LSDETEVMAVALAIANAALAARVAAALVTAADVIVLDAAEGAPLAQIVVTDAIPDRDDGRRAIVLADRAGMVAALRGGASAVLAPTASAAEILLALRAAAQGLAVMPEPLLESLVATEDGSRPVRRDAASTLTARELEVLALLAEGAANKVIARRLGISVHTAKFHVASILDKLDATGRTDAVTHAIRLGLLML
jgi:DNA-binding NarL/FixJ family response regulator